MAKDSNSQDQNSGFVGFLVRNQVAVIVVALIILFGGYFLITRNDDSTDDDTEQTDQQTGQNESENGQPDQNQNGDTPAPTPVPSATQTSGNVTASGTLKASDNAARGNLMIDSQSGKIYISTKRDFSALVGQTVTLQAEGSINSFKFLGLNGSTVAGTNTGSTGSAPESSNVAFNGTLRASDNLVKSNYMVVSGSTKVYVKSARDYASLVGKEVTLSATGTLNGFSNAKITQK